MLVLALAWLPVRKLLLCIMVKYGWSQSWDMEAFFILQSLKKNQIKILTKKINHNENNKPYPACR